jgi:hypothetical protein
MLGGEYDDKRSTGVNEKPCDWLAGRVIEVVLSLPS